MSHYSVKPIRLLLQRSYLLAVVLMLASLGACLIVLCMPVHVGLELAGLKLAVCVLIIAAAGFYIALHAWLVLPWSYCAVELDGRGELRLLRQDGVRVTAMVLPGSFVSAYLTVLNVKIEAGRWPASVILTPDRVDAAAFRQLRVWLRWGRYGREAREEEPA